MLIPEHLHYTKNHEWVKFESDNAIIGITDFAQGELGDIIFVELPKEGTTFKSGDSTGTIEAVKTVADIYAPIGGKVIEVNRILDNEPELINNDPYETGWILKLSNISKIDLELLSSSEYSKIIQ